MNPALEFENALKALQALPDGRQPATRAEHDAVKAPLVRALMGVPKRPRWFREDVLHTFRLGDLALLGALHGLVPDDLRAARAAPAFRAACPPATAEALKGCGASVLVEAIAIVDEAAERHALWRSSPEALAERAHALGLTAATATALVEIPPPPDLFAALGRGQRGGSMRANDARTDAQRQSDFIAAIVEAFAFERDAVSSWPPARIVRVGLMAEQALELKRQAAAVGPEYEAQPAAAGSAGDVIPPPPDLMERLKARRAEEQASRGKGRR